MRHRSTVAVLAAFLALSGCNKSDSAAGASKEEAKEAGPGITLSEKELQGLALATAKLPAVNYRGQIVGYGVVTALDAVGQSYADTATAEASATQSAAAAARAKELSTGEDAPISRETYEAAAAKAAADQAALGLARGKSDAAFGISAPWRTNAERDAIMARLRSGRSVLVRATFPSGSSDIPQSVTVSRLGMTNSSWKASSAWRAPSDPAVPGHSLFLLVDGSDLAQGERVVATIPIGATQSGVIVPADALIIGESETWAYLKIGPATFLRAHVDTSHPQGNGYFVAEGFKPGQEAVTRGAGLLYAHEINPSTEPEE